ncbi:MAG: thioesterase family protein [Pseudonocardiaceae bacterium]|nr:thioesterase family protein [Pseudonocardiaceae bacterium]
MRFGEATAVEKDGDGIYRTRLHPDWSVGRRLHGGYLLAPVVRAAMAGCEEATPDPVAVSAQYYRPPQPGPASVRTELLKQGRTVAVVRAVLEQDGVGCVEATVNAGTLSDVAPTWADPPVMPDAPGDDAVDISATPGGEVFLLTRACEVYLDPDGAAFLSASRGAPRLRLWARPRGEQPDLLFALLAGDIAMPTTFNLGMFGWTPTVQLTALLRAHPAPGWLGVSVESRSVHGGWFDEDATVTDSSGRIVCQARQLALTPR